MMMMIYMHAVRKAEFVAVGHFSRDCPTAPTRLCFNCGEEGHSKTDCTNEYKPQCRNCDAWGHTGKECKQPRDCKKPDELLFVHAEHETNKMPARFTCDVHQLWRERSHEGQVQGASQGRGD